MRKIGIASLIAVLTVLLAVNISAAYTLVVDQSSGPYNNISDALDDAYGDYFDYGITDTIVVNPGIYDETFEISFPVILKSKKGADVTIIQTEGSGCDGYGYGIAITGWNVKIDGFTIRMVPFYTPGYGDTGIVVGGWDLDSPTPWPVEGVEIRKCTVEFFSTGIGILNAVGTQLNENVVRYITDFIACDEAPRRSQQPEWALYESPGIGVLVFTDYFVPETGITDTPSVSGTQVSLPATNIFKNRIFENASWGIFATFGDFLYIPPSSISQADGGPSASTPWLRIHNNTLYRNGSFDWEYPPSNSNLLGMGFYNTMNMDDMPIPILITNTSFLELSEATEVMPIYVGDDVCTLCEALVSAHGNKVYSKLISNLGGGSSAIPDITPEAVAAPK